MAELFPDWVFSRQPSYVCVHVYVYVRTHTHAHIHISKNCDNFFIILVYTCFMGINIILAPSKNVYYLNKKSCMSCLLTLAPLLLAQAFLGVPRDSSLIFESGIMCAMTYLL